MFSSIETIAIGIKMYRVYIHQPSDNKVRNYAKNSSHVKNEEYLGITTYVSLPVSLLFWRR